LRSPSEYASDHCPGAINVPLFDDQARAIVGTLYKQDSPESAYRRGVDLAEDRMPAMLSQILGREVEHSEWQELYTELAGDMGPDHRTVTTAPASASTPPPEVLLHCSRGGMRSRSVAALLQRMGIRVGLLTGGYKAYRSWVMGRLDTFPATPTAPGGAPWFVLVSGATGTGKTLLLRQLEEAAPGTVLDLEGLADHRSSILGAVGRDPVGQRRFDSLLTARLDALGPSPWFVEAESRKVGDIILPAGLYAAMRAGHIVDLQAPTAFRVQVLMDDYLATPDSHEQIAERLPFLENRLGAKWVGILSELLAARDYPAVTEILLERYYDPLYEHSGRDLAPARVVDPSEPGAVEALLAEREAARARSGSG
jgi:tRNA 2-selenouridine synthase